MENIFLSEIIFILATTLRFATPLIYASIGGVFSEKSGVVNIGLEGMMVMGAFFAVWGTYISNSSLVGFIFSIIFSGLIAVIHAILSVFLRANQVISGIGINLFATSLTSYLIQKFFGSQGQTSIVKVIPYPKELFSKIPLLGKFLSELNWFVLGALVLVVISWFVLYRTNIGYRIRAVGEHPRASDTLGINVYRTRFLCVMLSGVLAGIGGASLSIANVNLFRVGMVSGRGYIALAAMIFGNWKPHTTFLACLIFSLSQTFEIISQKFGFNIPTEIYFMMPYILTMMALAFFVRRSNSPLFLGQYYDKGKR